jgi:predicted AAA+ superfamily ATPase
MYICLSNSNLNRMIRYLKRAVNQDFKKKVIANKVLILLGARRVGKTELIKSYLADIPSEIYLQLNGEDINDINLLKERSVNNYKRLLKGIDLLVIDEAQNVPDIGQILKLIVDSIDGIKVIATGSSMFDLSNKLGEPLVGRKNTIYLFPLAQIEFSENENYKQTIENLEERLLFGGYPELVQYESWEDKKEYLFEIINSYLLKDILVFEGIKHADKIYDLLRLISYQIGKEVSIQELANQLQLSKNTVSNYLDLLSKVFILFKIEGFSRNLRKEIVKSSRWYFYDNGIRNAIINNFNTLDSRNDVGDLWKNYLAYERLKKQNYQKIKTNNYFWRTYDQQELDWLEEIGDKLEGFEFKWNENKKVKIPTAFAKAYPEASFNLINKSNYLDFII